MKQEINIPKVATKQLRLQSCSAGRKLVVSTNWLPLFGFESNSRVKEELIGPNKGIRIILVEDATLTKNIKKVYTREYKTRKNNPFETLLDIRSQNLINEAFPENTENVHIQFTYGLILITPISNKKASAIKQFKESKDKEVFLACSSGVDGVSMVKKGFKIETLLEYRPNEKRDKNDLSETGALNAINNFSVNHLINEDIMNVDIEKIAKLCENSKYTNATFCLQCDDFSNAKSRSLKEASIEDGSTTIDMVLDALNIINKFNFPTVLIENVYTFFDSEAGAILQSRLRRYGYTLYLNKMNATDFGGLTNRIRGYLFATMLPAEFSLENKNQPNDIPLWELLNFDERILNEEFRDVSDTKTIKEAIATNRLRIIDRQSLKSGTVLKSQNRQAKDSIYIYDNINDKYYFPSNLLLAQLMGIDMNFSTTSKTIESEIIGQSIDVKMHEELLDSINIHLSDSYNLLKIAI